jgi:hypothetical protein
MSELQIGLLAIGVVVVVGVLAYNRIQERRAGGESGQSFRSTHQDVLMRGGDAASEPARPVAPVPAQPVAAPASDAAPASPNPLIDYVVELQLARPATFPGLQESWQAITRRHGGKVLLEEMPAGGLKAGLQLVSSAGAVGEADLIEFRSALETLAASAGATVSAPEMRAAVQAARELDDFCAESDIQVVLHLVAPAGGQFPGTKIRAGAEAGGLALEANGRFALRNDAEQLLFTLAARDGAPFAAATLREAAIPALSLSLDLPRTPDVPRAFEAMTRLAHQLATALAADIVDDNGNRLDDHALATIARELRAVSDKLAAHGISPGSALALRLFS